MVHTHRLFGLLLSSAVLLGCSADATGDGPIGVTGQAISLCNEVVPPDRMVDGIPAYDQCPGMENALVFSNNGVDTSATMMGPDWKITQWGGGYQCTEFATRYLLFKHNVPLLVNGDAGFWCDGDVQPAANLEKTMTPSHGDLMVMAPGSCGASPTTGHVTVVDVVEPGGTMVTAVGQNGARRGTESVTCAKCFIHVKLDGDAPTTMPGTGGAGSPPPTTPPPTTPPPTTPPTTPPPTTPPPTPIGVAGMSGATGGVPGTVPPTGVTVPAVSPGSTDSGSSSNGCAVVTPGTSGTSTSLAFCALAGVLVSRRRRRTSAAR